MKLVNKKYTFTILATCLMTACTEKTELSAGSGTGNYIVVLKKSQISKALDRVSAQMVVSNTLVQIAAEHGLGKAQKVFSQVLQGGVYKMSHDEAAELSEDPNVAYVEEDKVITINALVNQSKAIWGLDRIDQISLPLSRSYSYENSRSGLGVNVYVIDTGILTTHQQFGGRAISGADFVDNDKDATDCNGHGTHVAGTIGSQSFGVAKNVKLVAVRVLNCLGSGTTAGVIAGIEWVTANHVKPAVANMSLGGGSSQAIDDAVTASIAAGVTYAVAAGNDNIPACNSSPARVPTAITVGSSTQKDKRSDFSNYGSCVSLFAPGSDIKSTWFNSKSATNTISGTSMASPHVAGAAALYLSFNPTAKPAVVKAALLARSLSGKIAGVGSGSPNLLLNTQFLMSSSP